MTWEQLVDDGQIDRAIETIQLSKPDLSATDYFHIGQCYAYAGPDRYHEAIESMNKSFKGRADWDNYVNGTIAFLEDNRVALARRLKNAVHPDFKKTLLALYETNKDYGSTYDSL